MRIVLSASGLVAEDAVVDVSVVVQWSVVVVAVLWLSFVAVVLLVRSVLLSVLWAAAVLVRSFRLGGGPRAFLESGCFCTESHHHFSLFVLRKCCLPTLFFCTSDRYCSV